MAKSKKKRQQDFQKVKLKVGKKLKKADNVTNASFRTRGIQISQQLKTGDASQPSTKKKHNITDLFSQCRHYSTSVRVEAVNGLKELLTTNPHLVQSHLSDILERLAELLTDKDSVVRQGAIRVFKFFLPLVSEKQISPFFPLLCAHLCCAMTHIYDDIQVDSLVVLDLLLDNYPRLMIYRSNQVLSNFIEQISRQQGQGQAKRSLSTDPNSATSSVKWRSSVLNRLQKFLSAILKFQELTLDSTCVSDGHNPSPTCDVYFTLDEVMSIQKFPVYIQEQWVTPGFILRPSMSKDVKLDVLDVKFPEFAKTLIPLLLECWVESAPSKDKNKFSGVNSVLEENVGMMYNILQVTQLLWQCTLALSTEQSDDILSQESYLKEFEQHFMANFPYSVNTRISKKGKKQQAAEQVSAEVLNLSICNIMTHFISKQSTNQRKSPFWLPMITMYLNDFLKGKYGRTGVGQSARTVVNILNRLVDRGLCDVPVYGIITEAYNRFEAANISSTEKKVYMQFFAVVMLHEHSHVISPQWRQKFLHSLPELLLLCTKENSEITSLVINTMKKSACQKCSGLLDEEIFNKVGQQWFDPCGDVITKLSAEDQISLVGLLYYTQEIDLKLTKILVSFARCSSISNNLVTLMIQVLQNRYLRNEMEPEATSVHISFLTNLLVGVSRSDMESLAGDIVCPVIGKYNIIKHTVLDGDNIDDFDRHCFIVEVVCSCVQQFYNTDQVVEVMFEFIEKLLETSSSSVPLQMVFGICKFVKSLSTIPPAVVSPIIDLSISLVGHMITWEHSTNQNAVKMMLDLVSKLIMDIPGGLERLLQTVEDCLNTDIKVDVLCIIMKSVMLFLTEGRGSCIRSRPECLHMISNINNRVNTYLSQHQALVTPETENLTRKFNYLVSCVK